MGLKAAWKALFSRSEATPKPARTGAEAEPLIGVPDLADLTAAVNSHHAEIAQLRLEWSETLDKFTAWANRQAARDRVRMKKSMGEIQQREEGEEFGFPPPTESAHPIPGLLPGMDTHPGNGQPGGSRHHKADLYARVRGVR